MVSQFVSPDPVRLLSDLAFDFPEGTHAIGRLDNHSEGLLILTTNKNITRLLFQGTKAHTRRYLVLVKNNVTEETLTLLRNGIVLKTTGGADYLSKPYHIERIEQATSVYPYAIDEREAFPHTWLLISLTEGKFHQVRKMVFAVGHRCLRLIRISIEELTLEGLEPGGVKELDEDDFFTLTGIRHPDK